MCMWQSRKVIWDMINTLFPPLQLWNLLLLLSFSTRKHKSMASPAILSWLSLKNRDLKITHNTFRDCRVHFFRQPFSKWLYASTTQFLLPEMLTPVVCVTCAYTFQICLFSLCLFVSKQILISKSPLAPFASFVYTIQAKGIVLEHQNVTGPGWCKTLEFRYFMLGWDKLTFSPSFSLLSMTCTRRSFHLKIIKAICHCCVTFYTKELRSDHWYTSKICLCSAKENTVEAPLTATFFLPSWQKIHTLTLG